jgi:hypothetical protein
MFGIHHDFSKGATSSMVLCGHGRLIRSHDALARRRSGFADGIDWMA